LALSIRQVLEAHGTAVGAIRVCAVDVLERGATGKAPLIMARRGVLCALANRHRSRADPARDTP
jgi:hypothetical protein